MKVILKYLVFSGYNIQFFIAQWQEIYVVKIKYGNNLFNNDLSVVFLFYFVSVLKGLPYILSLLVLFPIHS